MPAAFALLVGAQLIGEILRRLLHLPLPGPVIGMFLLAVVLIGPGRGLLENGDATPAPLASVAHGLIGDMGLLFVPAGVGVMSQIGVLRHAWLPILAGLLVSTILGLMVTALVMHGVIRMNERRRIQPKDTLQ